MGTKKGGLFKRQVAIGAFRDAEVKVMWARRQSGKLVLLGPRLSCVQR